MPISAIAENSRNKKYNQNINYRLKATPSVKICHARISGSNDSLSAFEHAVKKSSCYGMLGYLLCRDGCDSTIHIILGGNILGEKWRNVKKIVLTLMPLAEGFQTLCPAFVPTRRGTVWYHCASSYRMRRMGRCSAAGSKRPSWPGAGKGSRNRTMSESTQPK